jgi:hypothetical protein
MPTVKNEPGRISDWLLSEDDGHGRYSRDIITLAPNTVFKNGQVLGLNAAGTQGVVYDNVGPDGAQAVGILTEDVTTTTLPVKAAMVARHARIAPSGLVWAAGLVQVDKDAALADLKALGLIPVSGEA